MGVTELILVRHGESTANVAQHRAESAGAEQIEVGLPDADVPLSELGITQARAVGRQLAALCGQTPVGEVWSSPYRRAHQTAGLAVAESGLAAAIRIDERLRDKELGILDTLTSQGVQARHPEEAARKRWLGKFYYRAPGGESWADLALRVRSVLVELEDRGGERVVVFAHDAIVSVFRYVCLQMSTDDIVALADHDPIRNGSVSRFGRGGDGQWSALDYNNCDHLLGSDGVREATGVSGEAHVGER